MQRYLKPALAALAVLTLAACGDDDDGGVLPQQSLQEAFGSAFATAFANSGEGDDAVPGGVRGSVSVLAEPRAVNAGDIIPVSFTTDPVDIPNT